MARQQQISLFSALRPTGVDPTAGARSSAIAGLFDQIGGLAFQVGAKQREKEGAIAGAQAGLEAVESGEKIEPKDSSFSIFDQSYDQSMRASYIAGIDNDNKEKLSQLASDNGTDTANFLNQANKYKSGVLSGLDSETSLLVQSSMDKDISNISIKIREAEKQKNLTEADEAQQIAIQNNIESSLGFAFEGDFEQAAENLAISQKFNDARLMSGKISAVEHKKTSEALTNSVDIEANRSQFNNMLDVNSVDKMINFIQKVSDEKIKGKSPEEHRELLTILQADMDKHYRLQDRVESELEEREKEKQSQNNEKLFLSMMNGELTPSMLGLAMKTDSISFEQGKALTNTMNTRGTGTDDHSLIIDVNELMRTDPNAAKTRIMENFGTNLTGDTARMLMSNASKVQDEGTTKSVLNAPNTKRYKRFVTKFAFDPGIGGFGSVENNKKIAQLELIFDERVLDGEDPALVASELIDFDEFQALPQPQFGSNDDPEAAQAQLDEFYAGELSKDLSERTMSDDDYNRESLNLQRAKELKKVNDDFQAAIKEALSVQQ